jgi:recombination protein RecA
MTKEERLGLIKESVKGISKDYGESTVMRLGEKPMTSEDVIPTGSLGLDIALGIGGLPKGRIVEIYGPESSGKTTLATHVIAEAQKLGGICGFVDVEHAFDREYAESLGVNADDLFINQPSSGEEALEIADRLVNSGGFDVIVLDSVAALVTKSELEGDMGDSKMGAQARLMSQALRKLTASISTKKVLFIFINQLREKIGVMFGNPETTSGGNALKFYASIRLDVRRSLASNNMVKDGETAIGNQVTVKVIKNKVAPPFGKAIFDILYGEGIDKTGEVLDIGADLGIVKKSGSWYSYNDAKIGQGRDAVRLILKDNPELQLEIENLIKQKLHGEEITV